MVEFNSGIQTKNDRLSVRDSESEIQNICEDFKNLTREELVAKYDLKDSAGWKIDNAISDIKHSNISIIDIMYRTFDIKKTLYTGHSSGFIGRPREKITKHFINNPNIAILLRRNTPPVSFTHVFITDCMVSEGVLGVGPNGRESVFPLYLYNQEFGNTVCYANLNSEILSRISDSLSLKYSTSKEFYQSSFSPIDLLDYIYAVLYSPNYREKYKEFLKIDFPRVPYPTDQETFWKLVEIGGKLRECHLMQTEFDTEPYSFIGDGTNEVVKPEYKNGRVYISKTQYFDNVPQAQWEQYIGGYQPLQKWLKDRKKTALSAEDIEHYKKIIADLRLTEELMAEIDQVVEF